MLCFVSVQNELVISFVLHHPQLLYITFVDIFAEICLFPGGVIKAARHKKTAALPLELPIRA